MSEPTISSNVDRKWCSVSSSPRRLAPPLAILTASLLGVWVCRAQDPAAETPPVPVGDVHGAIIGAGIPVRSVHFVGGRYEFVFPDGCPAAHRVEAEQICERVSNSPKMTVAVDNVTDALVVLRFEPHNPAALAVIRKRYFELKAQ
jgi:hypothetical protein